MSLRETCRQPFETAGGRKSFYSLDALAAQGYPGIRRLPVSLRIVLESLLRNCDGKRVQEYHVRSLASWRPEGDRSHEVPFVVGRIVLQDVAGIPLLGDLAGLREAAARAGRPPSLVRPHVPVDMVIDHAIEVDYNASADAPLRNMQLEMSRNEERFRFVKWAMQAIDGIRLVPPGFGILHQVNLEFLARGLLEADGVCFPDTLVGTDSHTCMIAGLGVVGWGVGGIEAEAAMLGQPVSFATPEVVGVHLTGALREGVTSTDLVLHMTRLLRQADVIGQFVEFFGEGAARLSIPDRATVSNMAPEYGATIGFFPFDERAADYFATTGRTAGEIDDWRRYLQLQHCFGMPADGEIDYSRRLEVDLSTVEPLVAGPRRPQDGVPLSQSKPRFREVLTAPADRGGYGRPAPGDAPRAAGAYQARDGDVLIAAITSCTNTSNPSAMLAAGLLARAAARRRLRPRPWVKTSLAPGSRVVSHYLEANGLQQDLDAVGFAVVGYGCTTCVGNSGPLPDEVLRAVADSGAVCCAVLSGNRNFEARIHPSARAAYLASPPLVVAYALAGTVDIDFAAEPLATDAQGRPVYLRELWPAPAELDAALARASDPALYQAVYRDELGRGNPLWDALPGIGGELYPWDAGSTHLKEPPYFTDPDLQGSSLRDLHGARPLAILGDSVTTDHISPIGSIAPDSSAARYLREHGVAPAAFGSYGSRRMNHEIMVRGGFGNVLLRNRMAPGAVGPWTLHQPDGQRMSIYDASVRYRAEGTPLVVLGGAEYGTGSARDWAAKATRLLGVRAVVAESFERIHRSNLAGMGVLPCQLPAGMRLETLGLDGSERFSIVGLEGEVKPRQPLELRIERDGADTRRIPLTLRLDTPIEVEYAKRGGILPYTLENL
ncbi:aconitate hydratase AcnA [Pigmentiphaga soli]|uniref:Aconitate hydratase n=1 Tax=Pigmentiphaga soli TaxID=1007095 RepID=A0ABP8GE93_9BURK